MTEQATYAELYAAMQNKPLLLAAVLGKNNGAVGLVPPDQYTRDLNEKVNVPPDVGRRFIASSRDSLRLPIWRFIGNMITGIERVEEKDGEMILSSATIILYLVRRLAAIGAINYNR